MENLKIKAIYKLTNIKNNKIYIGQARDIHHRMNRHKNDSKHPRYRTKIARAIVKYGWDNFELTILEVIEDECQMNERETYWIELYKAYDNSIGYNILPTGFSFRDYHHSEESKAKMSEAKSGMYLGDENPMYGKKHSEETKAKMREKANKRLTNPMSGRKHSEESRAKMRLAKLKRRP
jgi:group I intron endonuclease